MPRGSNKATATKYAASSAAPSGEESLDQVHDAKQRKKVQNRIAQRTYRKKIKERLDNYEHWQDLVKNAFRDQSQPNLNPFQSATTDEASRGNRWNSRTTVSESPPTSSFSPNLRLEQPPISWVPALDPLLSLEDFTNGSKDRIRGLSAAESVLDPQRAVHADPDLTMFDEPSSLDKSNPSTVNDSILSVVSMLPSSREEPSLSLNQSGDLNDGKTALHLAAERGKHVIVSMLLGRMRDINIQDQLGRTALHLAVGNKHGEVVEALLANRQSLNVQDHEGQTALHVAVAGGEENIVELLLQADADLELKDNTGRTALHVAAQMGCDKVMQQLLNKGANIVARIG